MSQRTIVHADLDAFFASVEILDDPTLFGLPVIVGGRRDDRGVVSAASYEARRFGVHSAMPLRTAARLCPDGVFVPGRFARYEEVSGQVMAVFAEVSPLVEPISLDEAFLDVTGSPMGGGELVARHLKERVREHVGLVLSVGVASNKLCAKVASDLRKPDGLVIVPPGHEAEFLAPLPVSRLWGIGPRAREALAEMGVQTIGQLAALADGRLRRRFGALGAELAARARGLDPSPVVVSRAPKSIGHETTFTRDETRHDQLPAVLLDLAESVAARLRRHDLAARGVQLKLRYEGFETLTRQGLLSHQVRDADPIYRLGLELLRLTLDPTRAVRLIGLTAIHLSPAQQLTLFDADARTERLDQATDAVRRRFGERAITRARLVGRGSRRAGWTRPPQGGGG